MGGGPGYEPRPDFSGTYTHSSAAHLYFHFDSWRVSVAPDEWIPAFIYVEESKPSTVAPKFPRFKAQTRLWGYNIPKNGRLEELTSIAIETEDDIKDRVAAAETTPLESQRSVGASGGGQYHGAPGEVGPSLALPGPVDEVLNTVVNNLIVSNNLGIEAKCRVLLTTPLETFSVGQTIVISPRTIGRMLPDEANLANRSGIGAGTYCSRPPQRHAFRLSMTAPCCRTRNCSTGCRWLVPPSRSPPPPARRRSPCLRNRRIRRTRWAARTSFVEGSGQPSAPVCPNLIRANLGNQIAAGAGLVRLPVAGGSRAGPG